MSLNIGTSLTGGFRRFATRVGLVLTLAYLALGLAWQITVYGAFAAVLNQSGTPASEVGLPAVEAPIGVLAGGAVVSLYLLQYLTIVAIRTSADGALRSIPSEYFTRNIVFVIVNIVLGRIAFGLLVLVGTILLIITGIVAYVAFTFTVFFVAVEDENFIASLRDSWTLTRGNWLRLFVLLLIETVGVGVASGVLSVLGNLVVGAVAAQVLGTLVAGLLSMPFSLLVLGILAEAFDQLRVVRTANTGA